MKKIKATGICLSILLSICTVSFMLVDVVSADETDYYVSNAGSDSYNGMYPSYTGGTNGPWKTIAKVNSEFGSDIQPGDNVYFERGDTFNDAHLTIDINGVSIDDPTVIGAYGTGDKPLFEGRYLVVDGVHNVTVENISIANITGIMIQVNTGSTYLTLQSINGYKSSDHAIYFGSGCSHVIIRDCYINITYTGGNDIIHGSFSYGLIENNTFRDSKHSSINLFRHPVPQDEYVIIRNNTIISPRRSLDIYVNNALIENNHLIYEARGSVEASPEQFCGSDDIILRDNYLLNGSRGFLHFRMTYESDGTQYVDAPMERVSIYHNTLYTPDSMGSFSNYEWNGFIYIMINTADYENTYGIVNMSVKNNIMSGIEEDNCISMYYIWPDQSQIYPVDNLFDNNIIYVNEDDDSFHTAFRQGGIPFSGSDYIFKYNISQAQTVGWPSNPSVDFDDWVTYTDNEWDDPLLNPDFSIQDLSTANNTAENLTVTSTSRTSTWVDVDNAQYFYPRISILGEIQSGDSIYVGDDLNLEVLDVNYVNNSVQVNRSISYASSDGVSLMRYRSSMNIGAYQISEDDEPEPFSGDGYQFWNVTISDPDGDTTSGTIVCSDGSSMSWTDEANGTRSLNITNLEYDTNYTVWLNFTDGVCSVYEVYWFITGSGPSLAVDDPYPVDEAVEVARPPVNLSAFITGSDIDVYFYFVNMTPTSDVWTLVDSWNGISDERVAYTTLSSFGTTYEFLWGNTTYTWSVNCTDGADWVNESFTFTTVAVADGSDARYDVDNDGIVFVGDLSRTWAKRTSQVSYIGLYDVDEDDTVFVGDLSRIWANR